MSVANRHEGEGGPTRSEVRVQLDTMLADRSFAGADRLSRMLRYLVETTIDGSPLDLKEYTVGIDVFDRSPSFDPRNDSVVRVHGSRLRAKLAEYYGSAGLSDPVIIELPKGGYVPVFRYKVAPTPDRNVIPMEPRPVIVPQRQAGGWDRKKVVGIALASALVLGAGVWMLRAVIGKPSSKASINTRPLTSMEGNQRFPSFSPDGSQVVFSWEGESKDNVDLYLTNRDGSALRRLTTDPQLDTAPAWSPDGRFIAFRRGEQAVMLVSPLGGTERKIADTDGRFISWTPESDAVLISKLIAKEDPDKRRFALFSVPIATGEAHRITAVNENPDGFEPFAISPDGKNLAYESRGGPRSAPELYVRPMGGGAARQLTHLGYLMQGWAWTADSAEIVFSSSRAGWFSLWRIGILGLGSEPVPVPDTDGVYPTIIRAAAPAGRGTELLAYARSISHRSLRELELLAGGRTPAAAGPATTPILPSTRADSSPQFSPDGKWIAFVSNRSGREEIWRSDAAGRNPTALTSLGSNGQTPGSPRWSPDSRQIAFDVRERVNSNIYVIDAEGGAPRKITGWAADQIRPSWSRDGQWIYFGSTRAGRWGIWKVPAAGARSTDPDRAVEVATDVTGFEPRESADGSIIYFFHPIESRRGQLFSVAAGGGVAAKLMDAQVSHGWWALASNGIYFAGMPPGNSTGPVPETGRPIQYFSFETHRVTDVSRIDGRINVATPDFCISPDERRLLYGRIDLANTTIMLVDHFR